MVSLEYAFLCAGNIGKIFWISNRTIATDGRIANQRALQMVISAQRVQRPGFCSRFAIPSHFFRLHSRSQVGTERLFYINFDDFWKVLNHIVKDYQRQIWGLRADHWLLCIVSGSWMRRITKCVVILSLIGVSTQYFLLNLPFLSLYPSTLFVLRLIFYATAPFTTNP